MRTASIHLTSADLHKLSAATNPDEALRAIGKLVTWALGDGPDATHRHVQITGRDLDGTRGQPELLAVYRTAENDPKPSYVIGAVWHDDHFGFHS